MSGRSLQDVPAERRCTARSKRSGERCRRWATPGSNVCRMHGGRTPHGPGTGAPIKHGLYSKYKATLGELTDAMYDPELAEELALTRMLLERLHQRFALDEAVLSEDLMDAFVRLVDQVRKLVDSMNRPRAEVTALLVKVEDTDLLDLIAEVLTDVAGPEVTARVAQGLQSRALASQRSCTGSERDGETAAPTSAPRSQAGA